MEPRTHPHGPPPLLVGLVAGAAATVLFLAILFVARLAAFIPYLNEPIALLVEVFYEIVIFLGPPIAITYLLLCLATAVGLGRLFLLAKVTRTVHALALSATITAILAVPMYWLLFDLTLHYFDPIGPSSGFFLAAVPTLLYLAAAIAMSPWLRLSTKATVS